MEKSFRLAITGPESTGKSAMANTLAKILGGHLVPEYARLYLEQFGPTYTQNDIVWIAQAQQAYEVYFSRSPAPLVICDTDILVCRIWSEFVFGSCPPLLEKLEENSHYDFTLLMDIDLPWEPDPLREHPNNRRELLNRYQEALDQRSRPYKLISGHGEIRFTNALEAIRPLL